MLFVVMFLWWILLCSKLITCHSYKWLIYPSPLPWTLHVFLCAGYYSHIIVLACYLLCPVRGSTFGSFELKFWITTYFCQHSCSFPLPWEWHIQDGTSSFSLDPRIRHMEKNHSCHPQLLTGNVVM